MSTSIWRQPGIRALLATTFTGFTGYAVLLPVAPLWVVHGGSDSAQAGLVNGLMLVFTVLTQLLVPAALRRWGWDPVLVVGMTLLGVPALLYIVSDALAPVLVLSALRGIGFGVLTVIGSSAVAALVAPARRGAAIGAYGLAVALPNVLLLPLGPWLAQHVGFWLPFVLSAVPLAGIPASTRLAAALRVQAPDLLHPEAPEAPGVPGLPMAQHGRTDAAAAYRPLLRPMLLLLSVTLAGGALITFVPQMVTSALLGTVGLFVMGLLATISRWRAGSLADRYGGQRFLWPMLVVTAAGAGLVAWSVSDPDHTAPAVFLVATALLGLGYGALQNLTMVLSFAAVSRRHHNLASAIWNVGFDAGTALGSVAVGVIAVQASFGAAFWVVAALVLLVLPLALRAPAGQLARDA